MKLLDVTEFYSVRGGGVRSHLSQKGHVLCQLGHSHTVVAPGPRDGVAETEACPGAGVTEVYHVRGPALPYDPTYHLLFRLDKVRALISQAKPDVLEIHSPYAAALSCLSMPRKSFGIRTFVWHADFIDTYLRGAFEKKLGLRGTDVAVEPLWAWVRAISRGCSATFAATRWQADKLELHGAERVRCVPFGVEKAIFQPDRRSEAWRREIAPDESPIFVAIGRMAVEKRWDVVVDAYRKIASKTGAYLAIFGDGPERASLERSLASYPRARFFGFERDRVKLATALASADLLIHGCPFETFGLGVAEALACGVPAVLPDEGGAAEQASPGSTMLYRSGDADACAAAIETMIARDAFELRQMAAQAALRVQSVEDHFARMLDAYGELAACIS
ncbi:MAG: glycosyltransferase [Polyangiaceae bacterium]